MKGLFTSLLLVILTTSGFAQTSQRISYQSVVRNSSNELVTNQQIGMRISILEGSATGNEVFNEVQFPSTNINGLVSIQFGGNSDFQSIDWGSNTYFIRTEIDPTGGTDYSIEGVSQLLSVPYALYAENSGGSSPVVIASSLQNETDDGPEAFFQDFIEIDKTCLLTINATARAQYNGGIVNAGFTLTIMLDGNTLASDFTFEGESESIIFNASASTTIFLEPGTYNLEVIRDDINVNSNFNLSVNYFAVYAETQD